MDYYCTPVAIDWHLTARESGMQAQGVSQGQMQPMPDSVPTLMGRDGQPLFLLPFLDSCSLHGCAASQPPGNLALCRSIGYPDAQ